MLELPESATIARQITENIAGRTVTAMFNATHPHRFAWYNGDPEAYAALLTGRKIVRAEGHGAYVDILFGGEGDGNASEDGRTEKDGDARGDGREEMDGDARGDVHLALSDGTLLRYYGAGARVPEKYQLLLTLDDGGFLVCTVQMYGCIMAFRGTLDNPYYQGAVAKTPPLDDGFDEAYFDGLFEAALRSGPSVSAKALLATEQRIPGLGNGTVQDILFKARINPRRRISTLTDGEKRTLFESVVGTLREMTALGGRDTERDLFGNSGGYRCVLSKNTWQKPCPVCGGAITKEPYLGGAVYYCPRCQPR